MDAEVAMATLRTSSSLRFLDWHTFATDVAVWELVQGGRGGSSISWLESLRLRTYQETSLSDDALLAIAASCPRLTILDTFEQADGGASDVGIRALAGLLDGVAGCPLLRHLDLGSCRNPLITDQTLSTLRSGALPNLQFLGLEGCSSLSTAALRELVAHRPELIVRVESSQDFHIDAEQPCDLGELTSLGVERVLGPSPEQERQAAVPVERISRDGPTAGMAPWSSTSQVTGIFKPASEPIFQPQADLATKKRNRTSESATSSSFAKKVAATVCTQSDSIAATLDKCNAMCKKSCKDIERLAEKQDASSVLQSGESHYDSDSDTMNVVGIVAN